MKTDIQQLNHWPISVVRAVGAALVSVVGVIDYLTVPICITRWRGMIFAPVGVRPKAPI